MRNTALKMVHSLAARDQRVIYIGSDPGAGTLKAMQKEIPERYMIEGISEAHIIGMAAGFAMEGYVPYVNTIATFLTRRCYEQVAVDLCMHELPVRLIGNGGGLVYAPLGPTHQAIEDIAIMRALPNMTVIAPADADEMARLVPQTLDIPGPVYIRVAKGGDKVVSRAENPCHLGKGIVMCRGGDALIVTTGVMLQRALGAAELLAVEGVSAGIFHMHTLKPFDVDGLLQLLPASLIVTVEEHVPTGGLGSAVLEAFNDHAAGPMPRVVRLSLPDQFMHNYGSQESLLEKHCLTPEGIAAAVRKGLGGQRATARQPVAMSKS